MDPFDGVEDAGLGWPAAAPAAFDLDAALDEGLLGGGDFAGVPGITGDLEGLSLGRGGGPAAATRPLSVPLAGGSGPAPDGFPGIGAFSARAAAAAAVAGGDEVDPLAALEAAIEEDTPT
jgi:hypothetical protein